MKHNLLFETENELNAFAESTNNDLALAYCEETNKSYLFKETQPNSDTMLIATYQVRTSDEVIQLYGSLAFNYNSLGTTGNTHTFGEVGEYTVIFYKNDGFTHINYLAFNKCYALKSIIIPKGVIEIEGRAFSDCYSLTNVTFVEGSQLTSVGGQAFFACSELPSIEIPSGVTSIVDQAFYQCGKLTSITFVEGSQLASIGSQAFYRCPLTSITCYALQAPSILPNTFASMGRNGTLYYPEGSDYSSWLSSDASYLGYLGWNGVTING